MPPLLPAESILVAQAEAVHTTTGINWDLVSMLLAIMVPVAVIGIAGVVFGTRHARRERELEHAERLKALELGRTLPKDAPFWSPNNLCIALGVGMPMALFVLALVASQADPDLLPFIWPVAGALGGLGIIGGTLLALIRPGASGRPEPGLEAAAKRPIDPDTYDTAGRRGWDAAAARGPDHA